MANAPAYIRWHTEPYYVGSVQSLYSVLGHDDLLVSVVSDQGSVFDIGALFTIQGNSASRTAVRSLVFSALADKEAWQQLQYTTQLPSELAISPLINHGARTHQLGRVDANGVLHTHYATVLPEQTSNATVIRKFTHTQPIRQEWHGQQWYDYNSQKNQSSRMIALEYIVRMGLVTGSSLLKQYQRSSPDAQKQLCAQLGVDALENGMRFSLPLVECTTKHEPVDRRLSMQEASMIAALSASDFKQSLALASGGMLLAQMLFAQCGMTFWDGKWEFAYHQDELYFADTLDTDSVRLTIDTIYAGQQYAIHCSKQAMREYFIICHNDWYQGVLAAQQQSARQGTSVAATLAVAQRSGHCPPTPIVENAFLELQEAKAAILRSLPQAFAHGWTMGDADKQYYTKHLTELAVAEINYYHKTPYFVQFVARHCT